MKSSVFVAQKLFSYTYTENRLFISEQGLYAYNLEISEYILNGLLLPNTALIRMLLNIEKILV